MEPPPILLEENFLQNSLELFKKLQKNTSWDQRLKSRKTASFGVPYNYSGINYPEVALPLEFESIGQKLLQRLGFMPNSCLLNYYPDGQASIGYHADTAVPMQSGTGVAIISLGATRSIYYKSIKEPKEVFKYPLSSGSLLYMEPRIQKSWKHALPKKAGVGSRISLSFRHLI